LARPAAAAAYPNDGDGGPLRRLRATVPDVRHPPEPGRYGRSDPCAGDAGHGSPRSLWRPNV